jgi:outer membrane protein assembly factor BamB
MRQLLVISALGLLIACGTKSTVEPPARLTDFSPTAQVKRIWSKQIGRGDSKRLVSLSPLVHNDIVYVADTSGRVSALAIDSGKQIWSVETEIPIGGGIGFGDDLVLLGSKDGQVFALEPTTGANRWVSPVSSEVLAPPVALSGVVVVQTIDGKIFGLSSRDGSQLWMQQRTEPSLSLRGTSSPIISRGVALSGFASGKIVAFEIDSGRLLWERTVAHPSGSSEIERLVDVDSTPLVVGSTLFAASFQGNIVAIDMRTVRTLWSRDVSTYTGMDADQQNIYLTDESGNVLALDQSTGTSLWRQDKLHARLLNAPTLVAEYVAVGDVAGYVHWLSKDTGQFAARMRVTDGAIRSRGVAAGSMLFVQSQKGQLAALQIRTGTSKQR